MKALSIQQPWAELILLGIKDIENRTWKTNVRGDILIHASKKFDMESFKGMQAEGYFRDKTKNDFQMGGIVGKTTIVDCVTDSDSEWFSGDYGFVLEKSERTAFIPYKGELGFFNVEDDTVDRIHRFCHDCNKDNSYLGEKDFYMIKDEL